jgi:hypothetical protein
MIKTGINLRFLTVLAIVTGYTPLMNALNGQNTNVAGFLIRQGANTAVNSY